MEHKGTVTLETERLILRRFRLEDMTQVYENCWGDHEVWKWTNYAPMHSAEDVITKAGMFTERWLEAYKDPKRYSWAIQLKETGEVIGRYFGMNLDEELREIELTYEMGRAWWNHGLMTEATQRVIRFLFEEVGFNRIHAYHASGNPASGRVLEKAGMKWEGTLRQGCVSNNGIFDKVLYAILTEDFQNKR